MEYKPVKQCMCFCLSSGHAMPCHAMCIYELLVEKRKERERATTLGEMKCIAENFRAYGYDG